MQPLEMQIFVGLGNPGAKYRGNRHNIGFMAIEAIAEAHGFGPWRSRFRGEVSEGRLDGARVLLLKPATFMNLSGQSVSEALRFYKLGPETVTVFHDELDLMPGKLRVKTGGGHAGHNGLRSLHQHIGAEFRRVRLGIGHPGDKRLVSNYVLGDFAKADADWLTPLLQGIAKGAPALAAGEDARFLNAVALHTGGAKPAAPRKRAAPDASQPPAGPRPDPPPEPAAEAPAGDTRSALQKLADRFRR